MAEVHGAVLGPRQDPVLFNVRLNPGEVSDPECNDTEACSDLYHVESFAAVRARLEAAWRGYEAVAAAPDGDRWADDGILA